MRGSYCKQNNCPWYDTYRDVCNSPHDPHGGECDYDWATTCPACKKLIAVGDADDDGCCPYCGADLSEEATVNTSPTFLEKREWIEGYTGRWYRKKFFCPSCQIKIRTESWNEERCFGVGTILSDNTMPKYCPNCGLALHTVAFPEK